MRSRLQETNTLSTERRPSRWKRYTSYALAYIVLVAGIDVIFSWDQLTLERMPWTAMSLSLLVAGGLAFGSADRWITGRIKRNR